MSPRYTFLCKKRRAPAQMRVSYDKDCTFYKIIIYYLIVFGVF
jgi:hypothetical protein